MRSPRPLLLWLATTLASPALAAPPEPSVMEQRAGAWDRSVVLEQRGELRRARAVLLDAWGPASPSYEVTARIAWLSLLLRDADLAEACYRRAQLLPGAGPEATKGLASTLTLRGYQALEEADRSGARAAFEEALRVDPSDDDARRGVRLAPANRVSAELWGAFVGMTGVTPALGGAGLFAVRGQVVDWLRLGAAYRHLELSVTVEESAVVSTGSGMGNGLGSGQQTIETTTSSQPYRQEEAYGWLGFSTAYVELQAMGLVLFIDGLDGQVVVPGQAARLRLGHTIGVVADQALLFRPEGTSLQVTPLAFGWPHPNVGMAAGARFTSDADGVVVSGRLGLSAVFVPAEVHLEGFYGTERWPVSFTGTSVLSTAASTQGGGAVATWFALSPEWSLGLHGSLSRIFIGDAGGSHFTAGAGLRWSPSLEDES